MKSAALSDLDSEVERRSKVNKVPYRIKEDDQITFIHVPKTAGTSFIDILLQKFPMEVVCPAGFNPQLFHLAKEDFARYRLFAGHFYYRLMQQLLPGHMVGLTFLRDPIERALSHYYQNQNPPADLPKEIIRFGEGLSLEEFAYHRNFKTELTNLQTRMLSSQPEVADLSKFEVQDRHDLRDGKLNSRAEEAMEVLRDMPFVGLTERFSDSLDLLAYTFGWKPLKERYLNQSGKRPKADTLPKPLLDRLMELNQEDLRLYEYGQKLFQERYQDMIRDLLFRSFVQFSPHFREPQTSLHYRFEHDSYLTSGWHPLEENLKFGTFCWTGPETVSGLAFPLSSETELVIQIGLASGVTPYVLQNVCLKIHDQLISLQYRLTHDGHHVLIGHIPKEWIEASGNGSTEFSLETIETLCPAQLFPDAEDQRFVGIAINWISFMPESRYRQTVAMGPFPADAYRAQLSFLKTPQSTMAAGSQQLFWLKIKNISSQTWSVDGPNSLYLRYKWHKGNDQQGHIKFLHDIEPEQEVNIPIVVSASSESGHYQLEFDLVHENIRWFECGLVMEIEVV